MYEMIAPDTKHIAVARSNPDLQFRIWKFDAGCDGRSPSVNTVETVIIHIIRKAAWTADTRNPNNIFSFLAEIGRLFLNLRQDRIVPATGTPFNLESWRKIFGC